MTKKEVVEEISAKTGVESEKVRSTVEAFMDVVKECVAGGEGVYLRGFGSFIAKERAEKKARNITKGTEVIVPAHSIPYFKAAPEFKEALLNKD